jgi:DNA-binding HxlR family transcriptional regulator
VTSYAQFCPVARALDVCGERWSLLIVRELLPGPRRFNELAAALPRLSRALLTRRLGQLTRAGICSRSTGGYVLTEAGLELAPVLGALGRWGLAHTPAQPRAAELDPDQLIWWLRDRFDRAALPARRTVMQVDLGDLGRRYWLILQPTSVDVCRADPGYDVDLVLSAETAELLRVVQGWQPLDRAMRCGGVVLTGPSNLTRGFPRWFAAPMLVGPAGT